MALREALTRRRNLSPGIRTRDAAMTLGVTEAELAACRVGHGVTRLKPDFPDMLHALSGVGEVMALTRNEHCVIEKRGRFGNVATGPGYGSARNHDVDLRLSLSHWRYGFAVMEEGGADTRTSLQVFDIDGTAVHKIYQTAETDRERFAALVERFRSPDQSEDLLIALLPPRRPDRPDAEIDREALLELWRAPLEPEDFFSLLQEAGISRAEAIRLAGADYARRVTSRALRQLMEAAVQLEAPILCVVGNSGCMQLHRGPVFNLKQVGPWFNVLDPAFNLHLREDAIREAWVVSKPAPAGVITSLELFDALGACFFQIFAARENGAPEPADWRGIIENLHGQ